MVNVLASHFEAILFRRWVLIKRSLYTVIFSIVTSLFFAFLAIVAQYLISTLAKENVIPITFKSFKSSESALILLNDNNFSEYVDALTELYYEDTGRKPTIINNFTSIEELNHWMYYHTKNKQSPHIIDLGFTFPNSSNGKISILYNSTAGFMEDANDRLINSQVILLRLKYKFNFKSDFVFSVTTLYKRTLDRVFGQIGPMLLTGALLAIIPMIISQPILDTRGESRSYMISCTLSLSSYWAATFLIDFAIWALNCTLIWILFLSFRIAAFLDNKVNTLFAMVFCGPSFIFHTYCFSYAFATPDSASRQAFIIICVVLILPIVIDIIINDVSPVWLNWLYTFYPPCIIQRSLMTILPNLGQMSHDLLWYFQDAHAQPFFIMMFVQVPIWIVILIIVERVRYILINGSTKRTYSSYSSIFEENKRKHKYTKEAKDMEEKVRDSHDFAVRICNVSRLFFNTAGQPVTAVNDVSLGVEENSIFGFLGANGAGKTTLIKMITSMLPSSNGTIEVNGHDISKNNDPTLLSICPQFNSHLCQEMTPMEHFKLFSLLHTKMSKQEAAEKTERLIHELGLESFKNQPIRELSGGDVRRLSIALSFLAPAKILLLDEPTASLDPLARHQVHEMILSYKGQKTIMLCTHLLSEAEFLCDMISIMIKGCCYTCGSPQYLTQKFGTDFKIDVLLNDESPESAAKLESFFGNNLPNAVLNITRPKARIYSIPASDRPLPDLFEVMQKGQDGDNGFSYFTCSSSSLERVFMELVHMSENDDTAFADV